MPRTHTGDKNRPYRRHRSHVTENKLGKRPATSTRNINILKMSEDLVVAAAWALLLLLQLGNVVSNVVHVGCTPGCWLARLLSLSDPYCQSMCLCVCLSVGKFDAKYLGSHLGGFVSNRMPTGKWLRRVDWWRHRWRTWLWRQTRDVTIFKVVAFGN